MGEYRSEVSRRTMLQRTGKGVAAVGLAAAATKLHAPAVIRAQTAIRMITPADLGLEREFYQSFLDEFQEEHPEIQVDISFESWDDYHLKLPTLFAGGAVPDVVHQHIRIVQDYGHRGVLTDLAPFMERDGVTEESYLPAILNAFSDEGTVYALPKDSGVRAMYYNKSMFDDAGLEYPKPDWTIDEFRALAQALTIGEEGRRGNDPDFDPDSRIQQWGFSWLDPVPTTSGESTLPFLLARGGQWYNEDYTETLLTDEPVLEHLKMFQQMRCVEGSTPSAAEAEGQGNPFRQGLTAMEIAHQSMDFFLREEAPDFEWGVNLLPAGPAGQFAATGSSGWAIASESDNKDAAWELVKYLTSEPVQARIATVGRWSPAHPSAADALLPENPTEGYEMAHVNVLKGESEVPLVALKYPANQSRITQVYAEWFDPIWLCDAFDVEAAAEASKDEIDPILAEKPEAS